MRFPLCGRVRTNAPTSCELDVSTAWSSQHGSVWPAGSTKRIAAAKLAALSNVEGRTALRIAGTSCRCWIGSASIVALAPHSPLSRLFTHS